MFAVITELVDGVLRSRYGEVPMKYDVWPILVFWDALLPVTCPNSLEFWYHSIWQLFLKPELWVWNLARKTTRCWKWSFQPGDPAREVPFAWIPNVFTVERWCSSSSSSSSARPRRDQDQGYLWSWNSGAILETVWWEQMWRSFGLILLVTAF